MQGLIDDLFLTASGDLAIGASYTFGEYVLPSIIALLHQHYPLIKPSITIANTKTISELVSNQQLDVGIVEGNSNHKKIFSEFLAEDEMYILVSTNH